MRHIATTAGMKPASVYHHYASKTDVLIDVLHHGIDRINASFDQVANQNQPVSQKLFTAHVDAHLQSLFEEGPFTLANVTLFPLAPLDAKSQVVPKRDAYEQKWGDLLKALETADLISCNGEPKLYKSFILGALNSSVEWFDPNKTLDVTDLSDHLSSLCWLGMQKQ